MTPQRQRILNIGLAFYALLTLGRAISNVAHTYGAGDLYIYWYAGHFVREQRNPYLAHLNGEAPTTPVTYLDGATFDKLPPPWITPSAPLTNTSPYVLLLVLLSAVNWYIAKWSFFLINFVLALLMPRVALWALKLNWTTADQLTVHLLSFTMLSTRTTLVNSQNSLMILLVILLSLVIYGDGGWRFGRFQRWGVAVLLGLALSKISLVIAIMLLLLTLRQLRPLIIAVIVQIVATAGLGIWTATSPLAILDAHVQIFRTVSAFDGIHLAYLLPAATGPILIATVGLFGWLAYWSLYHQSILQNSQNMRLNLFAILTVWSLLFAYHGPYDAVLLLPVYLYMVDSVRQRAWALTQIEAQAVICLIGAGIFIQLLPGNIDLSTWLTTPPLWPTILPKLIAGHMLSLFFTLLFITLKRSSPRSTLAKSAPLLL
ncbi:MAG: hypothetical protein ACPG8W_03905 [Candidatus Promineifilaceae bacterium]